jgi:hypothetical protein
MLVIGKTNGYFNLFNVEITSVYEAPFKIPLRKHNFIKKLATSQKKAERLVTEQYGPKFTVDVNLKGQHTYERKDYANKVLVHDRDNTVVWFGKHTGLTIKELVQKHPGYIDFLLTTDNKDFKALIQLSESWEQHLKNKKTELSNKLANTELVDYDDVYNVTFHRNLTVDNGRAYYLHDTGDKVLKMFFKHYKLYNYGGHTYALPVIKVGNKKSGKRIKNLNYLLKLKPITFGTTKESRLWNDNLRKFESRVVVEQEVEVVGMKQVK